jgi:hypothetical protein
MPGTRELAMNRSFLGAILAVLALAGSALAGGEPDGSLRTWLDGEYLMWWFSNSPSPQPLLTTGPLTNPITNGSGVLGAGTTQTLTGLDPFNTGFYNGFRINAGWIDCSDTIGVTGSFFYLAQHTNNVSLASDPGGNPLLARPVTDANTGSETVLFVSAPGAFSGAINFASTTALLSGDLNALWPVERNESENEVQSYLYFLTGARYLNLRDNLNITQDTAVLPGGVSFFEGQAVRTPGSLTVIDNFHTLNQFYGGQVGVQAGLVWWRLTLNGVAKIALGSMREEANISGSTALNFLGSTQTTNGGLLAQTSNIGSPTRNMVAVIPEGNLSLSVEITPQIKLMVGYTFLYVSDVARPGDQIDRTVNRALVPSSQAFNPALSNPQRPTFNWNGTDFWAQGVSFGIGLRF